MFVCMLLSREFSFPSRTQDLYAPLIHHSTFPSINKYVSRTFTVAFIELQVQDEDCDAERGELVRGER